MRTVVAYVWWSWCVAACAMGVVVAWVDVLSAGLGAAVGLGSLGVKVWRAPARWPGWARASWEALVVGLATLGSVVLALAARPRLTAELWAAGAVAVVLWQGGRALRAWARRRVALGRA